MYSMFDFGYDSPDYFIEKFIIFSIAFFFSVLFMQSGLDKLFDFQGNLKFLKTHFQNTIFQNTIKPMFLILIILELCAGFVLLISLACFLIDGFNQFTISNFIIGILMVNVTLCFLFLGQRVAKDYEGAASLVSYFIVSLLAFLVLL